MPGADGGAPPVVGGDDAGVGTPSPPPPMEARGTSLSRVRLISMAAVAHAAAAFAGCGGAGHAASSDAAAAADTAQERRPAPLPYARPAYQLLSETGLFSDLTARTVSPEATAFQPTYRLWSDGADKRRWVRLPAGTQIDNSDMDHWVFPIGTKFWKEFSQDGALLETRLIERYGEGPDDYWMGSFVWTADQTDAAFVVDGQSNLAGTMHDAPSQKDCRVCHRGDVGRVLGFSAMQLAGASTGPTLADLDARGLLTQARGTGQRLWRARRRRYRPGAGLPTRQLRALSQQEWHRLARHPDGSAAARGRARPRHLHNLPFRGRGDGPVLARRRDTPCG